MNQNIVVLMGGNSNEREVSLASGNAILQTLKKNKIICFGFDWNGNNLDKLFKQQFDKVFIALHGKGGEDGFIQHILEEKHIPYTGTNSTNSKNCMDKEITKNICQKNKLPLAKWITVKKAENIPKINFKLPFAVKPTLEGSSIGITKVNNIEMLKDAINTAFKYGNEVIIEEWITGKEYSVAIVDNEIFPVVEIISKNNFYDYKAKYNSKDTEYICPAKLSNTLTIDIQNLAKQTFDVMVMKDWGRIDFIKDNNNFYILEVNTVPGMTSHSLVPMTAKASGLDFITLVKKIIQC